jgi:hypothetical protein
MARRFWIDWECCTGPEIVDESLAPPYVLFHSWAQARTLVISWHMVKIQDHRDDIASLRKLRVGDIPGSGSNV